MARGDTACCEALYNLRGGWRIDLPTTPKDKMAQPIRPLTPRQLRAARRRLKCSLRALAEKTGYSHSALGHYETGARKITPRLTLMIQQLLAAALVKPEQHTAQQEPDDEAR